MDPLLNAKQAAKLLGIGEDTLAEMRKAGEIPYVNIGRGTKRETPRYDEKDLIEWREKRKQTTCPSPKKATSSTTISGSIVSDIRAARARLRRPKHSPTKSE